MEHDDPDTARPNVSSPAESDLSLIRWMLSLTPGERLQALQGFVDSASELRREQSAEV